MHDIDRVYDQLITAYIGFTIGRTPESEGVKKRESIEETSRSDFLPMQWPTRIEQDFIAASILSKEDYALWEH